MSGKLNTSPGGYPAPDEHAHDGGAGARLLKPIETALARVLLGALHAPAFALELADGTRVEPPGRRPPFCVRFRDHAALFQMVRNPRLQFGDLYAAGRIEVDGDLSEFMQRLYISIDESLRRTPAFWRYLWRDHKPRSTSHTAARDNIHHHYDIGNDFYRLWLDRHWMQYTCAYYPSTDMTLEQAQAAKLEHLCRKLRLRRGQCVVEAGCGWGGLAMYMAERHDVRVRAFNISREQVQHAREEAARRGLGDRVEFILDDYRNIDFQADAFVSVGMLEHVGLDNFAELGRVIDRTLNDEGLALIHSIGRNRPGNMNAWIERRIFPGAYPPSLAQCGAIFEPHGLSVLDVENLRLHYAHTLAHWGERFEAEAELVRAMFDAEFVRAWRLYLAGSHAAFMAGKLQLFQVVVARERNNAVPMNREHLYRDA